MAKRRKVRVGPLRNVHVEKPKPAPTISTEHALWPNVFMGNPDMKARISEFLESGEDFGPPSNSPDLEAAFADLAAGKSKTEHTKKLIDPVASAINQLFALR